MPTTPSESRNARSDGAQDARDAVARASRHARAALGETLAALVALLDASSLALGDQPAREHALLGPLARILDALHAELATDSTGDPAALLRSVADALDAEIARWEARAQDDTEARAVLRAFLGLRELLWEFGIRRGEETGAAREPTARGARKSGRSSAARGRKARVQRVTVEG